MNDSSEADDDTLIGISLASEAHQHDQSNDMVLGILQVKPNIMNLDRVRQIMYLELSTLPVSFLFLTKQGWPIRKSQEAHIKLKQIVCNEVLRIRRSYEKPRVGIRTENGTAVGFVFVDQNNSVEMLRTVIENQLGHIYCNDGTSTYQFVDRNGWPLTCEQESKLAVIDLLQNSTVVIQTITESNLSVLPYPEPTAPSESKQSRMRLRNALTFQSSIDQVRQYSVENSPSVSSSPKQVLISYVRAEAADHAVKLKESLLRLGCCSVYLDVHEIKSGVDWADSLNFAVYNCEIFVPLVTPRYGETQWTNREVKLADMLSKLIIPVSFLESWPPKCLAIQFATTQFISWRPDMLTVENEDVEHENITDIGLWDDTSVSCVAKQMLERIEMHQQQTARFPVTQKTPKISTLKSCPFSLPDEFSALSQPRDGQPMIVISVHPEQTVFADELKKYLESFSYEVYCSTEMWSEHLTQEDDNKSSSSEDELFSQDDKLSASKTAGSDNDAFLSQLSQMSMNKSPSVYCRQRDYRIKFQEKTDEAGVIVVVMSKKYAESRTSRMQVYYCEHRKRVVVVMFEDFCVPSWMSMLIGTDGFEDARSNSFKETLLSRIEKAFDKNSKPQPDTNEESVKEGIQQLHQQLPLGFHVFISGGTTFYNKKSESFCRAIGNRLAEFDDILLVTGGFNGVGKITSKAFYQRRQQLKGHSNVFHVLPCKDKKDCSKKAEQSKDGTFMPLSFGCTVFCGDSVRERETIVARVMDICILIEGGPGAAYEAEQFSWNDHVVIPVKVTGGAAGGKFNVPEKIFKKPCGVKASNWAMLSDRSASPDDMATAVSHIVFSLKRKMDMHAGSFTGIRKHPSHSLTTTSRITGIDEVDANNTPAAKSDLMATKKRKTME